MSHIVPFIQYFVEESLKKKAIAELYDSDINKACFEFNSAPVNIAPKIIAQEQELFNYQKPQVLNVFPSKEDKEDYLEKSELLIEAMHAISCQAVFEIKGNKESIQCSFYAEEQDIGIIDSGIKNYYPKAVTETNMATPLSGEFFVYDLLPDAPFYKSLTSYKSFVVSPLNMVPQLLLNIESGVGVYQVLFMPLPGELHDLVEEAVDCEWQALQKPDGRVAPSLQPGSINRKLEYKSPDFKSYYAVCIRLILPKEELLTNVKAFFSNYVYGSKAFRIFESGHYSKAQILGMINERFSYHSGFLLNSHELTSLLHIPHEILERMEFSDIFKAAPVGDKPIKTAEYQGTVIGKWACGNSSKEIHLPIQKEIPHCHVLGVSRSGKSVLLSHMAIEKFRGNEAVFVIDPHGDLIDNTLRMVPKDLMGKVLVIDFGLLNSTPQITIRSNVDFYNPAKASDDLSESMQKVGSNREKFFGPKMFYTFQCLYYIYCVLPDLDFIDIRRLISHSPKGKVLRTKVKARITNPIVSDFLDEIGFSSYESLSPVITVLSHLLLPESSLRLFTLKEGKISINDIMENGMLCLINLSVGIIGKQRSSILSGIIDSLITNNALARAGISYEKRKPCTIIKDEFYLGPGDLDAQLTGLAKYNIGVVFAHQYLDQVEGNTREVMATAGTRIAFKLRRKDAEAFGRDFGISPEEFTSLKKFEAIVKIEDEVVKVNTPKPELYREDYSDEIMKNCLDKYYLHHEDSMPVKKKKLSFDRL